MKVLLIAVVVFCISVQILARDLKSRSDAIRKGCIKRSEVDPALVVNAVKGDFKDDPKLKKFLRCFYEKMGIWRRGKVIEANLKTFLHALYPEREAFQTPELIKKCSEIKKAFNEDKLFEIVKCRSVKP